jgi:glycosidase
MKYFKLLSIFIVMGMLAGCAAAPSASTPGALATATSAPSADLPWWKTAVFYEIFVRSFKDSNGDGIGDFNGVTQELDYLNDGNPDTTNDLGITAIWLMPINPSPSYHGYDVLNYYNVNPEYGTMEDFKRLLEEAHKRGIRIIIDLVLNHTSSAHPFFSSAVSVASSPYRDWYIWSAESNGNHWYDSGSTTGPRYYYGYFSSQMPDLNYRNPDVTAQMEKVTEFWLEEVGVDGFRVDAAKHLIEDGNVLENTPETHEWFKGFYTFYKGVNPDAFVIGEVAGSDARATESYDDDQMDMVFNFELASGFVNSANGGAISGVGSAVAFIQNDAPDWNFGTFLTNHDQPRVMSTLGGNIGKAKVAAALLLSSPGTPFIYYGEEIGMQGTKPDEYIRRPMQWAGDPSTGFTTGTPWEPLGENSQTVNVKAEESDAASLLSWYKELIHFRQENPIISIGKYIPVKADKNTVYAALRELNGEAVLVVINLSKEPVEDFALSWQGSGLADGNYRLSSIFGSSGLESVQLLGANATAVHPLQRLEPFQVVYFGIDKAE